MNSHAEQAALRRRIPELQSEWLRRIAVDLSEAGASITFFGQAWGNAQAPWIYFDLVLDLESLREHYALPDHISDHVHTDPRSGRERGFIDSRTQEGLMGRLPG